MTIEFDIAPYNDDFESTDGAKNNNYMRILFRPEFPVQARELTQLQSILSNQIKSFGNHIFKDGSPVFGGHISLDTATQAITLESQFNSTDISLDDFFVDGEPTLIINASGATEIKAIVVAIDDTQNNPVLIVKYITGNEFSATDIIQVATGVQSQAQITAANAFSVSTCASINDGIFYSGGFFIQVEPQTILLDATTTTPTYRVGLEIQESIVDEVEDTALLDPALGPNNSAPGAHRYQYVLALSKRTLDSIDDSAFYELLRVENGLITQQIDYPVYADLEKTLARRTADQSGDFTVKPFLISLGDNTDNTSQFTITAEPGKAYVKGFEFETIGAQKIFADKALATNTVNSYGMSTEFGSIITVANVAGGNQATFFDVSNFANVDIHCVPSANINTNTLLMYNSTLIGTARVRDIEFLGLGQYYAYMLDISMNARNVIANTGNLTSLNLNAAVVLTSAQSAYSNAYANMTVSVNTSGVIDIRKVVNAVTSAANLVLTLDKALSAVPVALSTSMVFWYAIKDAESFVVAPTSFVNPGNIYFNQQTANAYLPCMDVSVSGKDATANTVVSDTQFNKLLFPLSQQYVAQGSILNASYYHRKNLFTQTFTAGNLAITSGSGLGTGESFPYGFTGQFIPDNTANANFIVIVKDKLTSNRTNGEIINFNRGTVAAGNGIFQTDSTHLSINTSSSATFTGDILFTTKITNASQAAVARRTKTVVGNILLTALRTTDSNANGGVVVIGNATTWIDTANGFVWYQSRGSIPNTPGSNLSLFIPDVFNIVKIFDSGDTTKVPNTLNAIDITNNYYLDSGQRDNYYDFAKLVLRPGYNPPVGQTMVMLQYYSHDSVSGFFDADSYAANVYSGGTIPFYRTHGFGTIALRDAIDFRPTRTIGTTANVVTFNLNGLSLPQPDNAFQVDFSFYLPRIDKLQLTKDKTFRILQGAPSLYPQSPADTTDAMTLYVLNVPAYTANVKEIQLQYVENKRYTMRDIGALDKRIEQLEFFSALSQLEIQSQKEKTLYQDGVTAKDSYGILADDFGNFSIIDNLNPDVSVFMETNGMSAYKAQSRLLDMNYTGATGSTPNVHSKTYSLSHTEVAAVTQGWASDSVSVQPFLFAQFKGHMQLTPETDAHYSFSLPAFVAAPPSAHTPETPTIPTPPAHPTLINANTPSVITRVVVGPIGYYSVNADKYKFADSYYSGNRVNYQVLNQLSGYGFINPVLHWYGVPTVTSAGSGVLASNPPNLGSALQLSPTSQTTVQASTKPSASRLLY